MKKLWAIVVIGCVVGIATPLVLAQGGAAKPDGIAADSWVPLGNDAGFVVTREVSGSLTVPGALNGFFMARRAGNWVRLEPERSGQIMQLRARRQVRQSRHGRPR